MVPVDSAKTKGSHLRGDFTGLDLERKPSTRVFPVARLLDLCSRRTELSGRQSLNPNTSMQGGN
jgi:hypothetical protein